MGLNAVDYTLYNIDAEDFEEQLSDAVLHTLTLDVNGTTYKLALSDDMIIVGESVFYVYDLYGVYTVGNYIVAYGHEEIIHFDPVTKEYNCKHTR